MEKMNVLTLIITLVVGVILTGALLGPVISDATTTEKTFTNEGIYYIVNDEESHDLVFSNGVATIDGEALSFAPGEYTVLATNDLLFRFTSDASRIQLRGALTGSIVSCDLTIANGSVTGTYVNATDQTVTIDREYTSYYLATETAEPIMMKAYTGTAYVMKGDVIMGRGLTNLKTGSGDNFQYLQIDAEIGGEVTISPVDGYTYSDVQLNVTPVDGYNDLYQFQSITFKATHTESGTVTNVTYPAVIIPAEVTAELTDHLTPGQIALMGAIPVMVIVALLMVAVGAIAYRRAD